ncbi:tRNA dimethylallyltransferase [candidate division SR1 bacterium]|nr:tRNA dimethylallyltransferase [candidate division SR1 bacterium]
MDLTQIVPEAKSEIEHFLADFPDGTVVIRGATATGKSGLSVELSQYFDMEVVSADSRQIFCFMDIGTDKIAKKIRSTLPHHQIDIIDPDQNYTAGQRKQDSEAIIEQILQHKKVPFIVGGTGLYIDTIYKNFTMPESAPDLIFRQQLQDQEDLQPGFLHSELSRIDPVEASKLHPKATRYIIRALEIHHSTGSTKTDTFIQQPVRHPLLMLGLWREKEQGNMLINSRIKQMIKNGLIDEVQSLLSVGYSTDLQSMNGIGYKEVISYLHGLYNLEKMEEYLKRNTHHLAKKQRTRFRRYIAQGKINARENVRYRVWNLG